MPMSKFKLKPMGDRIVVEPMAAETKTASGIYIPDTAQEKPQKGKVVAVGTGTKDEEMKLKVGDVVLYGKYAGTEVTVDNEKYLIMRQSDVLAIIEE
jgi:chaperonin GroES